MENQNNKEMMGVKALVIEAWNNYQKKIQVYLPILLIPFLVGVVGNVLDEKMNPSQGAYYWSWIISNLSVFAIYALLFVVLVVVASLSQLVLMYSIKSSIAGEPDKSLKELYILGANNLLSYWWVSLLTALAIMGGFILLIIPGIIFMIWYSFSSFVFVDQGVRGLEALRKSKEYVVGRWGKVFLRYAAMVLAIIVVSGISVALLGEFASEIIGSFVWTPIVTIYGFLLYKNLKDTKVESFSQAEAEVSAPTEQTEQ